jgi:hypothetical protein
MDQVLCSLLGVDAVNDLERLCTTCAQAGSSVICSARLSKRVHAGITGRLQQAYVRLRLCTCRCHTGHPHLALSLTRHGHVCFDVMRVSLQQQLRLQGSASAATGVSLLVKPRCLPDHSVISLVDEPLHRDHSPSWPFLAKLSLIAGVVSPSYGAVARGCTDLARPSSRGRPLSGGLLR